MRKIKITDELIEKVELFNSNLFINSRHKSFIHPIVSLEKLKNNIKPRYKEHRLYVKKIIDEYQSIMNADPDKMMLLKEEFNNILNGKSIDLNIGTKTKKNIFHEAVVRAMRYEDLREIEFPVFLREFSIKTCIYCNSQSTFVIEPKYYNKKNNKIKKVTAKLQLDHFNAKSLYPFLSTSFFNLYPSCANCNLAKGKKQAHFELYTIGDDLDKFKFWIDNQSILDYWIKLDLNNLKVNLESTDGNIKSLQNHNELFQIQAIYDKQIDIAEELIIKARTNPDSYRRMLKKSLPRAFGDPSIIDRLIIGNYTKPEEIFKRPMVKYSQDIARQLKLIK